jgi:NADPH:quinone reductase-like Zn-dependent oxidoreductase
VAGRVEAVGENVKQFRPGDEVFGCGAGAFAEYALAREAYLALKPATRSFEEAAAVPVAALTALQGLRDAGRIRPGQKVLIQGASGGVGTFAVQLAKSFGAEVTAVCSTRNLDMARSIGADHVIDYTQEDFTKSGQIYDVILDTIGKSSFSGSLRSLEENGAYLNANPGLLGGVRMRWISKKSTKRVIPWTAGYTTNNLLALKELIEAGTIKPIIDRRYPLEQTAEAHRYVDTGHKKGNVVITLDRAVDK